MHVGEQAVQLLHGNFGCARESQRRRESYGEKGQESAHEYRSFDTAQN